MITSIPLLLKSDDIYLEAFSDANCLNLWAAIQEDRTHPQRKSIWPGIDSFEDLRNYMADCNKPDSEEFGFLIWDSFGHQLGTVHVFNMNHQIGQVEVGFGLHFVHTGRGWATKAIGLLEMELKKLGFAQLAIHCQVWNDKSLAVAERCDFKRINVFHKGNDSCKGCDDCTVFLLKKFD